jgi:hypothetical protein
MARVLLTANEEEIHMSTEKISHPIRATQSRVPSRVENSTDATRGEPLALRAQKRRAELAKALERLPVDELRARNDIEIALASIDELLTGDLDRLSDTTAADLSRLLERTKHLAETTPRTRAR